MSALARVVRSDLSRDAVLAILKEAARVEATEVHFKVPREPMMRISGNLHAIVDRPLVPRDTVDVAMALASLAGIEVSLAGHDEVEFAFGIPGTGRFRVCIHRQRGSYAIALHRMRLVPPAIADLPIAANAESALMRPGLTLVCGADRTALIHALVGQFNTTVRGHIVVVECPIAYLHRDERAAITQCEVGSDAPDFATAIRRARRIGADQLVIGAVDDRECADAVLSAAEGGLPVIAAVGARTEAETGWWIARLFDGSARADAESRLSQVFTGALRCPHEEA